VKITCIQFCAIDSHITLGRIRSKIKKLSRAMQRKGKKFGYAGADSCFQCDLRLLFAWNFASRCVIIMENYTKSEMTDMVLC
jgi:hypothetical protein